MKYVLYSDVQENLVIISQKLHNRYGFIVSKVTLPEEMSHLHSEARGVWKHGGTKFKSDLKSILKTRTDCTVFGTMISASKGCHQLFQKEIFELLTTRFSFLHCRWKSLLQRNIVIA